MMQDLLPNCLISSSLFPVKRVLFSLNRKVLDLSIDVNKQIGIDDASVFVQPNNGYGDPQTIRGLLARNNFDAILNAHSRSIETNNLYQLRFVPFQ